jgi:hypothetical protein
MQNQLELDVRVSAKERYSVSKGSTRVFVTKSCPTATVELVEGTPHLKLSAAVKEFTVTTWDDVPKKTYDRAFELTMSWQSCLLLLERLQADGLIDFKVLNPV